MTCLSAYMYRQISFCTNKTPKKHYWGGGAIAPPAPPPSGYANGQDPQRPPNIPTKKGHKCERAPQKHNIFSCLKIFLTFAFLYNQSMSFLLLIVWGSK